MDHVLYLDTDVLMMANLESIWTYRDSSVIFQWGSLQCAGFVLLTVPRIQELWDIVQDPGYNMTHMGIVLDHGRNDQLLLRAINATHPQLVGMLPKEWDVPLARLWKKRTLLYPHSRPNGVGMLHFNGGGRSAETSAFDKTEFMDNPFHQSGWGLGTYYKHMPWSWAKFLVESSHNVNVGATMDSGNPIHIHEFSRI